MSPRQQALLELIKVTHTPAKDDRVCLEIAQRYLAAIDDLAEAEAPAPKKEPKPRA